MMVVFGWLRPDEVAQPPDAQRRGARAERRQQRPDQQPDDAPRRLGDVDDSFQLALGVGGGQR